MSKKQNKVNKKVHDKIQNAFKLENSSELSVSGYKKRDLEPSKKDIRR